MHGNGLILAGFILMIIGITLVTPKVFFGYKRTGSKNHSSESRVIPQRTQIISLVGYAIALAGFGLGFAGSVLNIHS